jgi:hypothetical protein
MRKVLAVLGVSLTVLVGMSGSGCSSDPAVHGISVNERAPLEELNQRYAGGGMTKEEYNRERAALHAKVQREDVQSGSPTNEAVRGILDTSGVPR